MTVAVVAFSLAAIPVTLLAYAASHGWGPLHSLDQGTANRLHDWASARPSVVSFLEAVSKIFAPSVLRIATALIAAFLFVRHQRRLAAWAAATMIAAGFLGYVLKVVVERARPQLPDPVASAPGYSFPSGHALNSFAFFAMLVLLIEPLLSRRGRWIARLVVRGHRAAGRLRSGRPWRSLRERRGRRLARGCRGRRGHDDRLRGLATGRGETVEHVLTEGVDPQGIARGCQDAWVIPERAPDEDPLDQDADQQPADDPAIRQWFLREHERRNPATDLRLFTTGNDVVPLIDGRSYFRRLRAELAATVSGDQVYFADFRGDMDELLDGPGTGVGEMLIEAARRGVAVFGLLWRSHPSWLHQSEEANAELAREISDNGGHVLLDARTRRAGSHHQKLVVIRHPEARERDIAFVGGIDLGFSRGDDSEHKGDEQVMPFPESYGPRPAWHDIQAEVRGPCRP